MVYSSPAFNRHFSNRCDDCSGACKGMHQGHFSENIPSTVINSRMHSKIGDGSKSIRNV